MYYTLDILYHNIFFTTRSYIIQYNIIQHCPTSYDTVSNDMIELWDRDKERLAWYVECSEIPIYLLLN